jgi:hypothetical protein
MKTFLAALIALMLVAPATAAVTTTRDSDLLKDFALSDINSTTSKQSLSKLLGGVVSVFQAMNNWLKDSAGIDFVGIIKTIADWIVIVINWVISLLKAIF